MHQEDLLECDVVLEGGVTSAVIYAGLLARLSETYRFRSLGGTSAGAVAAAAGAIAEYARRGTKTRAAFEGLKAFPEELAEVASGRGTVLERLFQPQPATTGGYRVVAAVLARAGAASVKGALLPVSAALLRHFPMAALCGAMPGLAMLATAWNSAGIGAAWPWVLGPGLLGLFLLPVLSLLAASGWAVIATVRGLVRNHFGMCNGMPGDRVEGDEALTPKLHALYSRLAGREPTDAPICFADLWGTGDTRDIDLQVITTVLSPGCPMRIPNGPGIDPLRSYFYDPDEWSAFFPRTVMDWLATHQRMGMATVVAAGGRSLRALPPPQFLPVVVAVRLSLSFPGLLSAVPMYVVDAEAKATAAARQSHTAAYTAEKVYFSDGGITSNCPIELFDAPLPGRPTFGVNLWPRDRRAGPGGNRISMHADGPDPEGRIKPFARRSGVAAVVGFVTAIVETATDWRDVIQRSLPGYRERMVHVGIRPDEGGLHLAMPRCTIIALGKAGALAADRLVAAFARHPADPGGWEEHRWIRLRSTLQATKRHLDDLHAKLGDGEPGYRLLPRAAPSLPPTFIDASASRHAEALMEEIDRLVGQLRLPRGAASLDDNAPEPAPSLRMVSPW